MILFTISNKYNSLAFPSMGHTNYLSVLKNVDCVLGNSSSGLLEAPSFKIGTINIGDRQKGRFMPPSVVNCQISKKSIINSINKILSSNFKKKIKKVIKTNKNKDVAKKIVKKLLFFNFRKYNNKIFYDI